MLSLTRTIVAAIVLIIAAIFDIKKQRIPNSLTFPAFFVGLILMCITENFQTILINIICVLAIFLFGATGILGLGDIKLLMALTVLYGWSSTLLSFALASVILLIFTSFVNPVETWIYITKFFRRIRREKVPFNKKATKYVFAPFLLFGAVITYIFVDTNGPQLFFKMI
ncbi:MAG: A24 family peptidase [Ruminococcus sp.]|nr:A24 family peptidase [Ruminococcus sp.]